MSLPLQIWAMSNAIDKLGGLITTDAKTTLDLINKKVSGSE